MVVGRVSWSQKTAESWGRWWSALLVGFGGQTETTGSTGNLGLPRRAVTSFLRLHQLQREKLAGAVATSLQF